jgi:multidrug efflux pump subunit AcrA (membrane-fusion protein)
MRSELTIVPPPAPPAPRVLSAPSGLPDLQNAVAAEPPIQSYVIRGQIVLALLFGGFGLWASCAPLTSAAIAPGVVKVDTSRKIVQHLDGGIVREILVHEGQSVKRGQVLIRLDSRDATADLNDFRGQIGALQAEIATLKQQLPSAEEQLADQQALYSKGYSRKSELFELERNVAKMKGDIEANGNRLLSLREEALKAKNKLERTAITAPQDGVVMDLRFHTLGGVIPPGAAILDIVPIRDKLVVEVQIKPTDIDVVRPDLEAAVRFVAYKQWMTPVVQGKVTRVSADAVTNERTGATYFVAIVEVNSDQLSRVPQVKLQPGMPVEAAIITGRRTMLAFLLQPITDSFAHAFREE